MERLLSGNTWSKTRDDGMDANDVTNLSSVSATGRESLICCRAGAARVTCICQVVRELA